MEWVKAGSTASHNLITSGMLFCPMSFLGVRLEDLEVNGPSTYGYAPLREAVARHAGVDPDCVFLAEGTSMVNHVAMAALLDPGDEVVVEDPCYELLPATLRYLGAEVRQFPRRFEERYRVDPEAVRRALTPRTRLIVLTNLHNPSSALATEADLRAVGDLAREAGARVLVDEVYLETLGDATPRSAFHLDPVFVTTNSLTKTYGLNGLRCGWALAEPALTHRFWALNDLFGVIPSHLSERVGTIAFREMPRLRARTREHLSLHWGLACEALQGCEAIEWFRPPSGTVFFPRLKRGNVDAFCEALLSRHGTAVAPGRFFGSPANFRVGIGGRTEILQEGLARLRAALDTLSQG
jgi:hypothetical protein